MDDVINRLRDNSVQVAVKNLMIYSLTILAVPLASMFFLKMAFFEGVMGYSNSESMMYSAIVAVLLVHVILVAWIFTATKDERTPKAEKED